MIFDRLRSCTGMASSVESARRQAFTKLQPVCSQLLQMRADAAAMAERLDELLLILQTTSQAGLQACGDYVLFPLLFIVDSISILRSAPGAAMLHPVHLHPAQVAPRIETERGLSGGTGNAGAATPPAASVPAASSDRVAEQALACCRAVLEAHAVADEQQCMDLLQRFSSVVALSRAFAAEEVMAYVAALSQDDLHMSHTAHAKLPHCLRMQLRACQQRKPFALCCRSVTQRCIAWMHCYVTRQPLLALCKRRRPRPCSPQKPRSCWLPRMQSPRCAAVLMCQHCFPLIHYIAAIVRMRHVQHT